MAGLTEEGADGLLSPVPVFLDNEPEGEAYAYVVDGEGDMSCEYELELDSEGTGTGDRSPPAMEFIDIGSLSERGRDVRGAGREEVDVRGVLGCVLDVIVVDMPSTEVVDCANDPALGLPIPERAAPTLLLAPSPPGIGGNVLSLFKVVVVVVRLSSSSPSHSPTYIPSGPLPNALSGPLPDALPGPFPNAPSDPLLNLADDKIGEGKSGDQSDCPTLRLIDDELPPPADCA